MFTPLVSDSDPFGDQDHSFLDSHPNQQQQQKMPSSGPPPQSLLDPHHLPQASMDFDIFFAPTTGTATTGAGAPIVDELLPASGGNSPATSNPVSPRAASKTNSPPPFLSQLSASSKSTSPSNANNPPPLLSSIQSGAAGGGGIVSPPLSASPPPIPMRVPSSHHTFVQHTSNAQAQQPQQGHPNTTIDTNSSPPTPSSKSGNSSTRPNPPGNPPPPIPPHTPSSAAMMAHANSPPPSVASPPSIPPLPSYAPPPVPPFSQPAGLNVNTSPTNGEKQPSPILTQPTTTPGGSNGLGGLNTGGTSGVTSLGTATHSAMLTAAASSRPPPPVPQFSTVASHQPGPTVATPHASATALAHNTQQHQQSPPSAFASPPAPTQQLSHPSTPIHSVGTASAGSSVDANPTPLSYMTSDSFDTSGTTRKPSLSFGQRMSITSGRTTSFSSAPGSAKERDKTTGQPYGSPTPPARQSFSSNSQSRSVFTPGSPTPPPMQSPTLNGSGGYPPRDPSAAARPPIAAPSLPSRETSIGHERIRERESAAPSLQNISSATQQPLTRLTSASSSGSPGALPLSRPTTTSRFTASLSGGPIDLDSGLDSSKLQHVEYFHLTHVAEAISSQVDTGIYHVHRIIQVLKKTLTSEDDFWRSHIRTIQHEALKSDRINRDIMQRTSQAWTQWKAMQIEIAQKHITTNSSITLYALVPLLEFHTSATQRKKELDREFTQREKECLQSKIALQKELNACEKLIDTWKEMKAAEDGTTPYDGYRGANKPTSPEASSSSSGKSSIFKSFSKFTSRAIGTLTYASPNAVQDKLLIQTSKYQEILTACNRRLDIFHTHELPNYLLELQRLEYTRLELVANCFSIHAQLCEERAHSLLHDMYTTQLPQNAATLDPPADLDFSIQSWIKNTGYAPVHAHLQYALPVSLEDIKAGRINGNPNSVFHVSLAHLMDAQSKTHPALPVPRVLLYMLDAIRNCNDGAGLEQEGVFRISPNKTEMEALKLKLNTIGIAGLQKSDIPSANVYLMCALLKEWLRALNDSVVPTKDYNACINIVKKAIQAEEAASAAASAGGSSGGGSTSGSSTPTGTGPSMNVPSTPSSATSSQLTSFIASLPIVNQRVLQLLSDFVAEIIEPVNHAKNKMTIENLSICFAPCLLRSSSEDPTELLMNSRYEIRAVVLLFRSMAASPSATTMCVTQLHGTY